MSTGEKILTDIIAELKRAQTKFPSPNPNLAALMEEVGELARAFLERKSQDEVYNECIQIAAMAIRCAVEGDPQFSSRGSNV